MKYTFFSFMLMLFYSFGLWAQEQDEDGIGAFAFGVKGGGTLAAQTWSGIGNTSPILSYHGDLFAEWMNGWRENKKGRKMRYGFQVQLGYHRKGSSFNRNLFSANNFQVPPNIFHNLSLSLLGKGYFWTGGKISPYYGIGLRADITLDQRLLTVNYENAVRRFTYGVWFGGGVEFRLGEDFPMDFFVELNVSPDVAPQIESPPLPATVSGLYDFSGNPIPLQAQRVINLVFEISVGVKIIPSRGVEYEYVD